MKNLKKILNVSLVAVAGVFCGYWLSSQQTDVPARSIVKEAVAVTSEAELAEATNAVVYNEENQEQPDLIPAKANTTRDKTVAEDEVPDETETVTTVSNKAVNAVVTKKPEQPVSEISETTALVEVIPVEEITEPPVEETIPAPAPPPVPAVPVEIDNSQQAQVLEDYNAVADAAIADVLNSLDL